MGIRALLSLLFLCVAATSAAAACREDTLWLRGDWGRARFSVSVADDAAERAQGLMYVKNLPASAGMLFVYEHEQPASFWMKNTLIPLDMIFADAQGRVIRVHENAIPGDLTAIPSGGPTQFVLEINGGLARRLGISEGSQMQHPAIRDSLWPCE